MVSLSTKVVFLVTQWPILHPLNILSNEMSKTILKLLLIPANFTNTQKKSLTKSSLELNILLDIYNLHKVFLESTRVCLISK